MARPKKGNALLMILAPVWGLIKVVLFLVFVSVAAVEFTTPSLNFASTPPKPYRSDQPGAWIEPEDSSQAIRSYRTALLTNDYRNLQVDFFAPDSLQSRPIPLTIIVAGLLTPDWLLDKVRPQGFNAVVIYRSPRIGRITGSAFPTALQARNATAPKDYWNLLASNPLNYMYNVHAALHEAPGDIVDIVRWATQNIQADPGRINIIGLGSGALIAAAAADGLQTTGLPARTVTLINPPALMASAIRDNLLDWPQWTRAPISAILEKIYFRLNLKNHLPRLGNTAKLLVIPQNAFELASYAAEPAVDMAGDKTTVMRIDMNFKGYFDDRNILAVRSTVGRWLTEHGGIQGY